MDEDEDTDYEENDQSCPFCGSTDECEHLLLVVDRTFQTAEGGTLWEQFNERWAVISEKVDGDYIAFGELLDEVDSLADASIEYVIEGGPGMTSAYSAYYCSKKEGIASALRLF